MNCLRCGKGITANPLLPLHPGARPRCTKCIFRKLAKRYLGAPDRWLELRCLFVRQNARCAYTGDALILNGNATIDHRQPKSRGGLNRLENLQWVTGAVNDMKRNLSHAEFVELCRKVAHAADDARAVDGQSGAA